MLGFLGSRKTHSDCLTFVTIFVALTLPPIAQAQAPQFNSVNDQTQTPIAGVGHNYQNLLGETVNFSNGSVNFKISFPVAKSRGFTLPYALSYNSASVNTLDAQNGNTPYWNLSTSHYWPNKDGWNTGEGLPYATVQVWSVNAGNIVPVFPTVVPTGAVPVPCNFQSGMTFVDPSGATHNLNTGAQTYAWLSPGGNDIMTCGLTQVTRPPGGDGQVLATLIPTTASNYLFSSSPGSGAFAVMDKNGTVYQFPGAYSQSDPGSYIRAAVVEDRNGNMIASCIDTAGRPCAGMSGSLPNSPPTAQSTSTITADFLNYTATWNSTLDAVNYSVAFQGGVPPSSDQVYCEAFPTTVTGTRNVLSSLQLPNGDEYQFTYDNIYGLLSNISYPEGGSVSYTWQLPSSSGSPVYNELAVMDAFSIAPTGESEVVPTSEPFCVYQYQIPVLATRTVSFDGRTTAQSQSFVFNTNWSNASDGSVNGWTTKTALVTTTDNSSGLTSKTMYTYIPTYPSYQPFQNGSIAAAIPVERTIQYYDWGQAPGNNPPTGSPIKTVTKTWQDQFTMTSEITTTAANQVSGTKYTYGIANCPISQINVENASFNYLLEQDDYDFGNGTLGPLKRKTLYTYQCFSLNNPTTYASYQGSTYTASYGGTPALAQEFPGLMLPPRVSNVEVVDGQTNAVMSQTIYGYDSYPSNQLSPSGAIQHDPNYSGTWTVRGNITSITRCNPVPQTIVTSCSGPKTTYTYDDSGQPTSKTDPCSSTCGDLVSPTTEKTTYSFKDVYSSGSPPGQTNTYMTSVTYPTPPSGATLMKSFTYNWAMGQLASSTDENLQPTNYSYVDPFGRLTKIVGPLVAGGNPTTSFAYNDGVYTSGSWGAPNVQTTEQMGSGTSKVTALYSDGMGHSIGTQLQSDPYGTDYTTTSYDGMGNVYRQSNPYRSTSESTYGVTTYRYDALGRKIQQTDADQVSKQQWCYDGVGSIPGQSNCYSQIGTQGGTWTDFTDEDQNDWQRTTDGLGRLTHVEEPNGATQAPSLETDYSYDALSNLLCAAQKGTATAPLTSCASAPAAWRPRGFTYDGVSQLLSATNPETGTVGYVYDLNGNVQTKTDARGIATNYLYDADNRLTAKTYSNDPTSTPVSCYQYDTSSVSGASGYLVGRLTNQWSQSQSASACLGTFSTSRSYYTLQSILSYDAMGHALSEQQCTPSNCKNSVYPLTYTFDLAGDLTSLTNGSTSNAITLQNCFDMAGRLQTLTTPLIGLHYAQNIFAAQAPAATTCAGLAGFESSSAPYMAFGSLQDAIYGGNALTLNRGYDTRLRLMNETDISVGVPTPGSATVLITGSEQSH